MKKKLVLLFAICMATVCVAGAQEVKIQGTWKLVEREGKKLPEGYYSMKLITPTHFMWTMVDNQGNIVSGAGGTYTQEGNKYVETLDKVLPSMKPFYNAKAAYEFSVENNRMTIKGKMRNIEIHEIWEKVE